MRLLLSHFLVIAFSFHLLILYIKGNVVHVAGICAGIIVGLAVAVSTLIHLGRRARNHEFTIVTKKPMIAILVMFFIIFPLFTVSVSILLILKRYFPQINWGYIWITFVVVALAVYSLIYTVGLFLLERRYGKNFYLRRPG